MALPLKASWVWTEKLEYGTGYSLVEVQAPYGYVLDLSLIHISSFGFSAYIAVRLANGRLNLRRRRT